MRIFPSLILGISSALLPYVAAQGGDLAPGERSARQVAASSDPSSAKILQVGAGKYFALPSIAAQFARDGDIIEIDAVTYEADVAIWRANNLTIRAVGNRAHMAAKGAHAEGKAIWVIKGNNTIIENIEFSGAKVAHRNGAGIRHEGAGLTLRNCYFHHNENGILTGAVPTSDIVIERSEFAYNGAGDGQSHNIYIGAARSFTLRHSYIHHANVGHNVKSRAAKNYLLYNRIMDERDGNSSYLIDLPNGGVSYVIGNLIQQGPRAENWTLISYGAEGLGRQLNKFFLVNNTLVNERPQGGRFLFVAAHASKAVAINNLFAGKGALSEGPVTQRRELIIDRSELMDPARYDYRLKPGSRAIGAGDDPGEDDGFNLRPQFEYVHPLGARPRTAQPRPDIGAYSVESAGAR